MISDSELADDPPIVRKKRKRLISDSELTNDPLIFRERRKRLISEFTEDPLVVDRRLQNLNRKRRKKVRQSDTIPSNDQALDKNISNHQVSWTPWTTEALRVRSEIGKFIRDKVKRKFGKGRSVYILHECRCWVLIRAGIAAGTPMYLFRKRESSKHEICCQAAVKAGNKFFMLTNCDGRHIEIGEKRYAGMKWCEMYGYKPVHKFPGFAESPGVEYFMTGRQLDSVNKK